MIHHADVHVLVDGLFIDKLKGCQSAVLPGTAIATCIMKLQLAETRRLSRRPCQGCFASSIVSPNDAYCDRRTPKNLKAATIGSTDRHALPQYQGRGTKTRSSRKQCASYNVDLCGHIR